MSTPTAVTKAERLKPTRRVGGGTTESTGSGSQLRMAFAEQTSDRLAETTSTMMMEQVVSWQNRSGLPNLVQLHQRFSTH